MKETKRDKEREREKKGNKDRMHKEGNIGRKRERKKSIND
jgi:hypothetical protein